MKNTPKIISAEFCDFCGITGLAAEAAEKRRMENLFFESVEGEVDGRESWSRIKT